MGDHKVEDANTNDDSEGQDKVIIIDGIKNQDGNDLKAGVCVQLNRHMASLGGTLVKWSFLSASRLTNGRGDRPGSVRVVCSHEWIQHEIMSHR